MSTSSKQASRFRPLFRTIAWLGLSAAQIIDFILVHNMVMKITQIWYDNAVTQLLLADPRSATRELDFVVKLVYFVTMVLLALIAVTVAIFMEHYFQQGEKKNILGQRVLRVAGIEVGIALLAILVVFLLNTFS